MSKGQKQNKKVKSILKFFKLNENTISTVMGAIVVFVIGGLIFNYFKTNNLSEWKKSLISEEAVSITSESGVDDKTIGVYRVVKGDDLWHIAEKYYGSGYNYVDIIRENKLSANGLIEPGMDIRIPKVEAKKATVSVAKAPTQTEKYTIKKGDSLWSIAVSVYGDGFGWTKIYWANKSMFPNPDVIHVGTVITIPALK